MKYPIVVGTDLSVASDDALIQAEARASRDAAPLTVVHVMPAALWGTAHDSRERDRLRELIEGRVTALTGRARSGFDVIVESGTAHSVLARVAAAQRALLIVGSHLQHGLGHALLRGVGERVVAIARVPVLVARPNTGTGRILVAVDRPLDSRAALDAAAEEAKASGATLVVLHCVNMGFFETLTADVINGGAYAARPLGQRSLVVEARRALSAELQSRNVAHELHVLEGPPQVLIPEIAEWVEAELVVVGTAHRPEPTPRVTTAVLRHTTCSVLVVDDGLPTVNMRPSVQVGPSALGDYGVAK